eukprot:XP_014785801.1 PREDICTED: uncharacterized protein LOC106880398 [Octopus bimaculoides]
MHRSFYDREIRDYACNCSSYILLSGNGNNRQKVFKMTKDSFIRTPIYLYWDKLPIEKVEFRFKKEDGDDVEFIFNGTGTNSTSWFQKDKLNKNPFNSQNPQTVTFNANFSYPNFIIEYENEHWLEARRESGNNEKYVMSHKAGSSK